MIRRIIQIDKEKCNGCGACAEACLRRAIAMADGKARLMRDDYCDGWATACPPAPPGPLPLERGGGLRRAGRHGKQAAENAERGGMTLPPAAAPGSQSRNIQREAAPVVEAANPADEPPFPMAGADQAGAGERSVF